MSSLKQLTLLIKDAVTNREPHEKFLHELDETMSIIDKREQRVPSNTYKPSSLGGCKRNMYFQVIGACLDEAKKSGAGIIGICETGSARHEILQTWVSRMNECGYDCEWVDVESFLKSRSVAGTIVKERSGMETKCYNEILNISFLCDGIIKYDGKYYILEIKTEDNFKHQKRIGPEKKHISQAAAYSVCLGIDNVIFLYENRNYCTRKSFLVEITDEMKQELVINEIEEIENYRAKSEIPPKSTLKSDCTYCNYKTECKKW